MSTRAVVYLLHFDEPYHHARHYLGIARDVLERIAQHRAGRGARLLEVICAAGIGFQWVRTWEGGRAKEHRLKRQKNGPRHCPLCRAEAQQRRTCAAAK